MRAHDARLSYALGSLYDRFQGLSDPRKAKGKRYSLLSLLVVIFLAKLSGQDRPGEIADWAKNHADALAELLHLRRAWMPHHNTIRRVFQAIVSETEFEQLLEAYHQQPGAALGEILALDGKALKGTRRADQAAEYVVSVYDGQSQRVLAQEVVETKENETPAPPSGACCGRAASLSARVVSRQNCDGRRPAHATGRVSLYPGAGRGLHLPQLLSRCGCLAGEGQPTASLPSN